jgi:nicotinate-nucleotide adenylyltransferase
MSSKTKRIGIYSGSFDPVHAGHLSFALQALEAAQLDAVYFLAERRPRSKQGVEHFGHRVAMLQRAVKPHRRLGVLELEDISFSVERTLPRLRKHFPKDQLVFLVGSDVITHMPDWSNIAQLHKQSELVIGVRSASKLAEVQAEIAQWSVKPQATHVVESYAPAVSSRSIREALRRREYVPGLLRSVERYSDHNWLYISLV